MTETKAAPITTTLAGHVLLIHVDREKKLNSFTPEMFGQLSGALAELEETEDAWVGVLTFQGRTRRPASTCRSSPVRWPAAGTPTPASRRTTAPIRSRSAGDAASPW